MARRIPKHIALELIQFVKKVIINIIITITTTITITITIIIKVEIKANFFDPTAKSGNDINNII